MKIETKELISKVFWIMILAIALLILFFNISLEAEMTFYQDTIVNNASQTVDYHAFYVFEDTSSKGIGKQKLIQIDLKYDINGLPYNLTYGTVDWCNFTIRDFQNIYGTTFVVFQGFMGGELLNTTETVQSIYRTSGDSGTVSLSMYDQDRIEADMVCHYTDVRSLFQEETLIGRFTTFFPRFACDKCTQYTLEQLSNEISKNENSTRQQIQAYQTFQGFIGYNWMAWLVASWVFKIGMIAVAFVLAVLTGYWIYEYFKSLEKMI